MQLAQSAAAALGEIPDLRAIPELAAQLDGMPRSDARVPPEALGQARQWFYAAVASVLARYGHPAESHLARFLVHPDPNRRIATIVGLRTLGAPGSRGAVAKLKSDPDPGVRQQAEMCDRIWGDLPGFQLHRIP